MAVDLDFDRTRVERVLREHGVVFALAFGSRVQGDARDESDLDLAIWGPDVDPFLLAADLDGHQPTIDVVDLRTAPLRLAGRVANQGVVVFDDDPATRVRWVAETRSRAADDRIRRERFDREFMNAVASGTSEGPAA